MNLNVPITILALLVGLADAGASPDGDVPGNSSAVLAPPKQPLFDHRNLLLSTNVGGTNMLSLDTTILNGPGHSIQMLSTRSATKYSLEIIKPGLDRKYCLNIIKPESGTNYVIQMIH